MLQTFQMPLQDSNVLLLHGHKKVMMLDLQSIFYNPRGLGSISDISVCNKLNFYRGLTCNMLVSQMICPWFNLF